MVLVRDQSLDISIYFEHGFGYLRMTMLVSHAKDEECALVNAEDVVDIQTRGFCSLCRNNSSVQVADLCLKAADSVFACTDGALQVPLVDLLYILANWRWVHRVKIGLLHSQTIEFLMRAFLA